MPRDTELRVLYFGSGRFRDADNTRCEVDLRPMRLVPSGGEPIDLTGTELVRPSALQTWVVARHVEPLAADTAYELQVLEGEWNNGCSCGPRQWQTVSSFTTGSDGDDTAPTFAGLERIDYREYQSGSAPCGDDDRVPVYATLGAASDTTPELRYNVYVDGALANPYADLALLQAQGGWAFAVDCGAAAIYSSAITQVPPGAEIEVRAIDLSGNESAVNATTSIASGACDEFLYDPDRNDNGLPDSEDPEPVAPAPARSITATSGCALAHEPGVVPLALAALPVAIAALRRLGRRRRR